MKIRWKIAALAGVLIVGLLAVTPLAIAPEPEDDFEECADNDVCLILQLTNEEVSVSGVPDFTEGASNFDIWMYVENPSENIERAVGIGGTGEDNVVVDFTILSWTDNNGVFFGPFEGVLETFFFPDRFDPVVHAFETKRVMFFGFVGFVDADIGDWVFNVGVALTFRGESFTLSIPVEIEIVE